MKCRAKNCRHYGKEHEGKHTAKPVWYTLEFAHDCDRLECIACGAAWAQWCDRMSVAECKEEAERQNAEWVKGGSPALAYRIVRTLVTYDPNA